MNAIRHVTDPDVPDDIKIAPYAINEVFDYASREEREAFIDHLLDIAKAGKLATFSVIHRRPSWLYQEHLLAQDPFADIEEKRLGIRRIPRDYWYRDDHRRAMELHCVVANQEVTRQNIAGLKDATWIGNSGRFLGACRSNMPLDWGQRLATIEDAAERARIISETLKTGV
ncbi:MAG: hypothetical protein KDK70_21790, partial [Myxococcales bacterium]|nr:hypothetical protein [Myxococcales bacterium]